MPNTLKTNNIKKNSIQIDIKLTPIITNTFANRLFPFIDMIGNYTRTS